MINNLKKQTRIFISYSRNDFEIANQLGQRLSSAGFEIFVDKESISAGEKWQERLLQLIKKCDRVLFLISPDSVASDVCDWEINQAETEGKSILPVVVRDTPIESVPGRLQRIQFIEFSSLNADRDAQEIVNSLNKNIEWERQKTEIHDWATSWDDRGRRFWDLRLSRAALSELEDWRDRQPQRALPPTALQLTYITSSNRAQVLITRVALSLLGVLLFIASATAVYTYDTVLRAEFTNIRSTLRLGQLDQASDDFRRIAANPINRIWRRSEVAKSVASEILAFGVLSSPDYSEELELAILSKILPPAEDETFEASTCSRDMTLCLTYSFRDARASIRTYALSQSKNNSTATDHFRAIEPAPFIASNSRYENEVTAVEPIIQTNELQIEPNEPSLVESNTGQMDLLDEISPDDLRFPDGVVELPFFAPDATANAHAVSSDGRFVAVSANEQINIWSTAQILSGERDPHRSFLIGFIPTYLYFDEPSNDLVIMKSTDPLGIEESPHIGPGEIRVFNVQPRLSKASSDQGFAALNSISHLSFIEEVEPNHALNEEPELAIRMLENAFDPENDTLRLGEDTVIKLNGSETSLEIGRLLTSALNDTTSAVVHLGEDKFAITLDSSECASQENTLHAIPYDDRQPPTSDVLLLSLEQQQVKSAWLIVCGPTYAEDHGWNASGRLVVSEVAGRGEQRTFLSTRISPGFFEIDETGMPLFLHAICGTPKVLQPTAISMVRGVEYISFNWEHSCNGATKMYYHPKYEQITFFGASYNSPSGDVSVNRYLLRDQEHDFFDNQFLEYFDRVYDLVPSPDGELIVSAKESSGLEIFEVGSGDKVELSLNVSRVEMSTDRYRALVHDDWFEITVPSNPGATFDTVVATASRRNFPLPKISASEQANVLKHSLFHISPEIDPQFGVSSQRDRLDHTIERIIKLDPNSRDFTNRVSLDFDAATIRSIISAVPSNPTEAVPYLTELGDQLANIQGRDGFGESRNPEWIIDTLESKINELLNFEEWGGERIFSDGKEHTIAREMSLLLRDLSHMHGDASGSYSFFMIAGKLDLADGKLDSAIANFENAAAATNIKDVALHWAWKTSLLQIQQRNDEASRHAIIDYVSHYLNSSDEAKRSMALSLYNDLKLPYVAMANVMAETHREPFLTSNSCDEVASSAADPFRRFEAVLDAELDFTLAIEECSAALVDSRISVADVARMRFMRGRGYAAKAKSLFEVGQTFESDLEFEKALADLNAAANAGYYPAAFLLGTLWEEDFVSNRLDARESAARIVFAFNQVVRCCTGLILLDEMSYDGFGDDSLAIEAEINLLQWAHGLGDHNAYGILSGRHQVSPIFGFGTVQVDSVAPWVLPN